MSTDVMTPTAKLRWVPKMDKKGEVVVDYILQQWWSNEAAVKMGPANMIKGEWREILVEETE